MHREDRNRRRNAQGAETCRSASLEIPDLHSPEEGEAARGTERCFADRSLTAPELPFDPRSYPAEALQLGRSGLACPATFLESVRFLVPGCNAFPVTGVAHSSRAAYWPILSSRCPRDSNSVDPNLADP